VLRFSGWLLPAILLCSFVTLGAWAILTTSLTLDEPTYIQAGLSYWQGNFTPNPEHPPVAKELIALPVVFLRAIGAISAPTSDLSLVPLYRLTSLLAGLGTVAVCGWWAWRLWRSRAAALTSMALAAFEPNLLANAGVATLDSFLTFFCALSAYLLWSSRTRAPTIRSAVAIGLVFGCAVGTKTSAIVLLPVVVFLTRPKSRCAARDGRRIFVRIWCGCPCWPPRREWLCSPFTASHILSSCGWARSGNWDTRKADTTLFCLVSTPGKAGSTTTRWLLL
jgi:dolichyl-phosphate-mannose--protein O-mannosyl transferase